MKKRIFSSMLCIVLMASMLPLNTIFTAADEPAAPVPAHYRWTFEDETLNDVTNGVYTADGKNNKLTVKTVENPTYFAAATEQTGATEIKTGAYVDDSKNAGRSGTIAELGKALYMCGVYFELENAIQLKADAPWRINLVGQLPNGQYNVSTNQNPDTAVFAGANSAWFIDAGSAGMRWAKFDTEGNQTNYTYNNSCPEWPSNGRVGQARIQSMTVWNEYNETAEKWQLHWKVFRVDGSDPDWDNKEYISTAAVPDYEFTTMGSASRYFKPDSWGNVAGKFAMPYLSTIEIWEDYSTYTAKTASVSEVLITAPGAGTSFPTKANLAKSSGFTASDITWKDAEGKAVAADAVATTKQNYTAIVTLTPDYEYAFDLQKIPAKYTATEARYGRVTLNLLVNISDQAGHYVWTFDDETLNDTTNGVYTADSKNNKLTVKTVENPTYFAAATEQTGATEIKTGAYIDDARNAGRSAVVEGLGKALYMCGVYFELETPIVLKSNAAWRINLVGQLPNGQYNVSTNQNPDTAVFAGANSAWFIDSGSAGMRWAKYDAEGKQTNYPYNNSCPEWPSNGRIGQARIQNMTVWNAYNPETQTWQLHWIVYSVTGATEAWDRIEYVSTEAVPDYEFTTMGSESRYFKPDSWGNVAGKFAMPYLSTIEIWEDTSLVQKTAIEAIPEDLFITPVANIPFAQTANVGDLAKVADFGALTWVDANGTQKTKAVAGNTYTASIKIIPKYGFDFVKDTTKVPEGFTVTLNDDGSFVISRTYEIPEEEETSDNSNTTTTDVPGTTPAETPSAAIPNDESTPATGDATTAAPKDAKAGCGSTISAGVILIVAVLGTVPVLKKRKEN